MDELIKFITDNNLIVGGALSPLLFKLVQSKKFRRIIWKFLSDLYFNLTSKDYKSHHFYANILFYKTLAANIKFECLNKTKLFKTLSLGSIRITEDVITNWIEANNKRLNKMTKVRLRGELLALLDKIEEDIERIMPNLFFNLLENREEANMMFKIIYYGDGNLYGYKQYKAKTNESLVQFITDIPDYESLSGYDILNMFLSQLDVNNRANIHDLKRAFNKHNGRLCYDS